MPRGFEGFGQSRRIVPEMEPYHEDDNFRDYQQGEKGYQRPFVSSEEVVDSGLENFEK